MNITIIGSGYVGLVSGACLAEIGHKVICYDISKEKIDMLNNGVVPIYEPGLKELIEKCKDNITFTNDEKTAFESSKVVISAVGTPMGEKHEADLTAVKAVAKTFSKYVTENEDDFKILVTKSTVPVGTNDMVKEIILNTGANSKHFEVVSNPEFLREGCALIDFQKPVRVVVGTQNSKAKEIMKEVYNHYIETQNTYLLFMDVKSAEITKYAANAMLATRISFMNEIANFCDIVGGNSSLIAKGIGLDDRIGPKFLDAGCGYGGSCFPKDVAALIYNGFEHNFNFSILNAVEEVNEKQRSLPVKKAQKHLSSLYGKTIAILGLSFKPNTDDLRESPALYCIEELMKHNATIKVYDPISMENHKKEFPSHEVEYCKSRVDAIQNADAVLVITDWSEFKEMSLEDFKSMHGNVIIDGRNIFKGRSHEFEQLGLVYENIGNNND